MQYSPSSRYTSPPTIAFSGNPTIANEQTNTPAPAKYSGPFRLLSNKCPAISGLKILNSLPQKLATPLAVPLTLAGNASGVHPYSTALNMLWKKYSMVLRPMLEACVLTAAKRNRERDIRREESSMAYLRPTWGV